MEKETGVNWATNDSRPRVPSLSSYTRISGVPLLRTVA